MTPAGPATAAPSSCRSRQGTVCLRRVRPGDRHLHSGRRRATGHSGGLDMKKATGPAKVEASVTPQGSPVSGVVALLFNFDFDDAAVKPEHQNWLAENLVPPLKADPGQRVFLRGMAS